MPLGGQEDVIKPNIKNKIIKRKQEAKQIGCDGPKEGR